MKVHVCMLVNSSLEDAMELLTGNEAADQLRISPMTVRRHIAAGRLRALRIGRSIRISREAIERFAVPVAVEESRGQGADESQPRPFTLDDPLWGIVGMMKDGPPDLSAEHDRYLAESYSDTHEE